ncbi:hypothetical protein M0R45_013515 [Rubus argutus]|uniref:Subtilisin-like protease n=1 Tax=Rubus argutus TaxID=59490 RepID=A0AAW1XIZ5_RUBAR
MPQRILALPATWTATEPTLPRQSQAELFLTSRLSAGSPGAQPPGVPRWPTSVYKVCWALPGASKAEGNTCFEEDMIAAMDDAIADGVDVLSISIGTAHPVNFTKDGIALGALHATKKNIVVACSAGNSGPAPSTLSNPAPWIVTVGASSLDRTFVSPVVLGNGMRIEGETVTPSKLEEHKMYPLVYAGDVVNPGVAQNLTGQCLAGSLSPEKVKGKIVLCWRGTGMRVAKGMEVKRAGGVGFILGNSKANGVEIACDPHVLPATAVTYSNANKIAEYINSTKNPNATIIPAKTVLHTKPAPFMTAFTSRGPSTIDPDILKPDITAPGLNILAAWTEADPPTKLLIDQRVAQYNIESGTSMSCPHIAAAAALLKAIHPTWSSAAIKSALMTTAEIRNNLDMPLNDESGNAATPFAYGSGHFRPTKARTLALSINLNYPSIAIPKLNGTITIKRTVTNVGDGKSIYFFTSKPPLGISVKASPSILFFDHVGQKKSFTITVKARTEMLGKMQLKDEYAFGWYTWTDGPHIVRSPIAVSLP